MLLPAAGHAHLTRCTCSTCLTQRTAGAAP